MDGSLRFDFGPQHVAEVVTYFGRKRRLVTDGTEE
jgi:hypothetical protein